MTLIDSKPRTHRANRRSGFSLIEVAVALAIFVFGALAIVRIFPGALGVIQGSESRAIATRLAQSTINRMAAAPQLVPDAVYTSSYDESTGNHTTSNLPWVDFEGAVNGTRTLNNALPVDDSGFFYPKSALGQFKRIIGEKQRVRSSGTANYVLTNYPYDLRTGTADINLKAYYEDTVENVRVVDENGQLDFANSKLASTNEPFYDVEHTADGDLRRPVDTYSNATLGISNVKRSEIQFYVSYRWRDSANRVHEALDEPLWIPDNLASPYQWELNHSQRVYWGADTTNKVILGTATVKVRIPLPTPVMTMDDSMRGFVPIAGTPVGTLISLDYNARDWRWIVESNSLVNMPERLKLPSTAPATVVPRALTAPTRFIRDTNNPPSATDPQYPVYTIFVGIDKSTQAFVRDYGAWDLDETRDNNIKEYPTERIPTSSPERLLSVNSKTGQIVFDTENTLSPQARVVYQSLDGWAQQISVAAKNYVQYHPSLSTEQLDKEHPREGWREFYWDSTAANSPYLYFHASEAGKTILVSFEYNDGGFKNVTDAVVTIDQKLVDQSSTSVPADFMGQQLDGTACTKVARAKLPNNPQNLLTEPPVTAIRAVKGASVQSRVAWLDGGQYTSTTIMGYRLATN